MNAFLGLSGHSLEADLEGAARIGQRIFWIESHARNKTGKLRENRHRFFATDFQLAASGMEVKPAGVPCSTLIEQMEADKRFAELGLGSGSLLMPKAEGALNIEGLAATADG